MVIVGLCGRDREYLEVLCGSSVRWDLYGGSPRGRSPPRSFRRNARWISPSHKDYGRTMSRDATFLPTSVTAMPPDKVRQTIEYVRDIVRRVERRAEPMRSIDLELRQLRSLLRAYSAEAGPDVLIFGDSVMY